MSCVAAAGMNEIPEYFSAYRVWVCTASAMPLVNPIVKVLYARARNMFQSIVSPLKFGFLNSLKHSKRRRLQSQGVGFGDSLEIRLLLTGPQLVNPTSEDAVVFTDVMSDHGGLLTANVDVDDDGIYDFDEPAADGDTVIFDLTALFAPNTNQDVILQIVESAVFDVDGTEISPEMSNSVTLNVAGITVLATEFETIEGADSMINGAVDMTNSVGVSTVVYRVAGDTEWSYVGEIDGNDGTFFIDFPQADGETDFEFAVSHTYMGATVLSSAVTIIDMTANTGDDPLYEDGEDAEDVDSPITDPLIDDLFAELFA